MLLNVIKGAEDKRKELISWENEDSSITWNLIEDY